MVISMLTILKPYRQWLAFGGDTIYHAFQLLIAALLIPLLRGGYNPSSPPYTFVPTPKKTYELFGKPFSTTVSERER